MEAGVQTEAVAEEDLDLDLSNLEDRETQTLPQNPTFFREWLRSVCVWGGGYVACGVCVGKCGVDVFKLGCVVEWYKGVQSVCGGCFARWDVAWGVSTAVCDVACDVVRRGVW